MTRYSYSRRAYLKAIIKMFLAKVDAFNRMRFFKKTGANVLNFSKNSINAEKLIIPIKKNILDTLSFKRLFMVWLGIIMVFAFLYLLIGLISPENGLSNLSYSNPGEAVLNVVYYSFIIATSTGFGDITPVGISKVVSILELIMGLIMFGILISKLVSFKQEVILNEIYDISLDEKVNRLRSALYLSRSDIDAVIDKLSEGRGANSTVENMWTTFNTMHETLIDVWRALCNQNKNEFVKTIGQFHAELILNSIKLSVNKMGELMNRLNGSQFKWASEKNIESIKLVLSTVESICDYHKFGRPSPKIVKRIQEIELIKRDLEKRMFTFATPLTPRVF